MVSFFYAILIAFAVYPIVFGWTLGFGFLYRLGLVDVSGACALHLVGGFGSFFGAWMIKPRLGRYEPLAVRKMIQKKEIYIQSQRK